METLLNALPEQISGVFRRFKISTVDELTDRLLNLDCPSRSKIQHSSPRVLSTNAHLKRKLVKILIPCLSIVEDLPMTIFKYGECKLIVKILVVQKIVQQRKVIIYNLIVMAILEIIFLTGSLRVEVSITIEGIEILILTTII